MLKQHIGKIGIGLLVATSGAAYGGYLHHLNQPPVTMTEKYVVQPGDTLWDIATVHNGGDRETGEVVYWIEKDNHISGEALMPGEVLLVPSADQK